MARKLRLEYPGAIYHVINRGNYRAHVFKTEGAKQAFEECVFAACERSGGRPKGSCFTLYLGPAKGVMLYPLP